MFAIECGIELPSVSTAAKVDARRAFDAASVTLRSTISELATTNHRAALDLWRSMVKDGATPTQVGVFAAYLTATPLLCNEIIELAGGNETEVEVSTWLETLLLIEAHLPYLNAEPLTYAALLLWACGRDALALSFAMRIKADFPNNGLTAFVYAMIVNLNPPRTTSPNSTPSH